MRGDLHVAIDGPAAAGKGTVAKLLSLKLGIPCLDTGAIYRGIGVIADGVREKYGDKWAEYLPDKLDKTHIFAQIVDNVTHIYIEGEDVTDKIRLNHISQMASLVGTIPAVRKLCTRISQELAATYSLIAEGRDICSVVLPNAKYKFYLDADANERAQRRYDELISKDHGDNGDSPDPKERITFDKVLRETIERDERDKTKGGLVKTRDAIVIDSTNLTVDQVVERMLGYIL